MFPQLFINFTKIGFEITMFHSSFNCTNDLGTSCISFKK